VFVLRGWRSRPEAGKPGPSFSVRRRYIVAGLALIVSLVVLGVLLLGSRSRGDYAAFAGCPVSNSATDVCIFARTESGELRIGKRTIPITRTITLQGGIHEDEATGRQEFIDATGGKTLSVAPQPVPGGLSDVVAPGLLPKALRERFDQMVARGGAAVTATTELVAGASAIGVNTQNLIEAKGIGLSLPMKVKLSSPFLGASCYIGSNTHPIVISLTTGAAHRSSSRGPVTGKPGHAKFKDDYNLVTLSEDTLIGDSFPAPRVTGCGGTLSALVDPAVDAELGLPVAAGHNEAIMNGTIKNANAPAVKSSG
jgi:hypothetical protein